LLFKRIIAAHLIKPDALENVLWFGAKTQLVDESKKPTIAYHPRVICLGIRRPMMKTKVIVHAVLTRQELC
jgi:hypothetical protein